MVLAAATFPLSGVGRFGPVPVARPRSCRLPQCGILQRQSSHDNVSHTGMPVRGADFEFDPHIVGEVDIQRLPAALWGGLLYRHRVHGEQWAWRAWLLLTLGSLSERANPPSRAPDFQSCRPCERQLPKLQFWFGFIDQRLTNETAQRNKNERDRTAR